VFPFGPEVPINREARGADLEDSVGDDILWDVKHDLDATLTRHKRLTNHEAIMKPAMGSERPSQRQERVLWAVGCANRF
jgi:hypothetical protein